MPLLSQKMARFGVQVILPAVVVVAVALGGVFIALDRMADETNRIEDRSMARAVEAAIRVTLRRIGDTHGDYAVWDDAVRNLYGEVNSAFVDSNFVTSTANPVFFDSVFLIDENGKDVFGYHFGTPTLKSSAATYGPGLAVLIDSLPKEAKQAVRTGFLKAEWGLSAVAVGPIVPFEEQGELAVAKPRLLVLSRLFNEVAVQRLAEDYLIDSLRVGDPASGDARTRAIGDPSGAVVGALAWSAPGVGAEARAEVSPIVIVMFALVTLTIIGLIAVAVRYLREVQRREAEARHAASHDALTGLPNRAALIDALKSALDDNARGGPPVGVVYLDLDGFKDVNDAYGHDAGDRLLAEVAATFARAAGDACLARVGGDEFAVLLRGDNPVKASCSLGWRLIDALARPFDIDGRIILVGTSVGVSTAEGALPTAEELVRRADVAMYQAKQQGPNRMFVYDPLIDTVRHERLEIASALRKAINTGDLAVLYQPVVDAASGKVVGVEALLRWSRPGQGPVSPATFIPIAEETGLINELGEWMLRTACRDALSWGRLKLSVNVSPAQFRNPAFETTVKSVLEQTGFPANRLEMEVTETYIVIQPDQARKAMEAIRGLGVSIALDDFGTGFSSIGYLRAFQFDKLKIDQSLISGIVEDQRVQRLVQATVALADAIGLRVTAEGVETEEEATMLRAAGCREFQGFHYGRPTSATEISGLLGDGRLSLAESA